MTKQFPKLKYAEQVTKAYQTHSRLLGGWPHGEPVKAWKDKYDNLCIKYESGTWFHYGFTGGRLQWW